MQSLPRDESRPIANVFCGVSAGAAVAACLLRRGSVRLAERMLATFSRHVSHRRSRNEVSRIFGAPADEYREMYESALRTRHIPSERRRDRLALRESRGSPERDTRLVVRPHTFAPLACRFRNRWCVDGGFSDNLIDAPLARTVKIPTGDPRADVRHKEYRQIESYFNTGERQDCARSTHAVVATRAPSNATTPNARTLAAVTESSRFSESRVISQPRT